MQNLLKKVQKLLLNAQIGAEKPHEILSKNTESAVREVGEKIQRDSSLLNIKTVHWLKLIPSPDAWISNRVDGISLQVPFDLKSVF